MKKVKMHKKIKKKKFLNKTTKKNYLKWIFLLLYIIIFPIIIIFVVKWKRYLKRKEKLKKYFLSNSNDEIYYKGEKVLKSKLIEDYLANISSKYQNEKNKERDRFNKYYYLKEYSNDKEIQAIIRKKVYERLSNMTKRTINKIDKIFLGRANPFGNNIISVNNAIFICEVLGCNQIILNKHTQRKWFISKEIYIEKLNITIKKGSNVDCHNEHTLCIYRVWDIFYPFMFKPEVRIQYIKEEIISNLPKVDVDPNDLYIHLRGGDIFRIVPVSTYAQPPLCFYETIINNTKFKNIYIIANDKKNTVFRPLIKKYNITYQKNSLEHDIYLLTHAYNLALSCSSFSLSSVKFNDNLKNLYEYDLIRLSEKFVFLHHDLYKFEIKYTIYSMKPSERYRSKMFNWIYSHKQRSLMLEDNCTYGFTVTKPNT